MAEEARDSGICVDNDNESLSSLATSSSRDHNQVSFVQRLRKTFECLAKEQDVEFHEEVNWWLHDERVDENEDDEVGVVEASNLNGNGQKLHREISRECEGKNYSKQSSIRSQLSHDSNRDIGLVIIPPTPPIKVPSTDTIIFSDYQKNNETNDSDSFDSASEGHAVEAKEKDDQLLVEDHHYRKSESLRLSRPLSTASQISNVSSKLLNIIRELQENEENYVRSLKAGIDNYMNVFTRKDLPKTLRGQKHRIFANIKSIHTFHRHEFLPRLFQCSDDPEQIAEVFTSFLTRDFFYGYIIYAINRKRSEHLCNFDQAFWKKIQNECGDRLGINSFLLQPIQRLPRLMMLLGEIIKDLSKDLENSKQAIAAVCVAEKNMQRLLDTVNESMSINDIRNCYEIEVLCQGKFKKMDEFEITDREMKRKFRGKVFLFEHCVIYTEGLQREYMEFRGYINSDKLGITFNEGKSKFRLYSGKRGIKEIELKASMNIVLEWNEIITGMLFKFAREQQKRNENSRKNSLISVLPVCSSNARSSMISTKSDQSMSSYRSSSGNSSLGGFDRRSHWYI